jgi:tetratricopeptide (TPR) repeat protein
MLMILAGACRLTAQTSALTKALQKIENQPDSPEKLDKFAGLLQENSLTGRSGRTVRRDYMDTVFVLWTSNKDRKEILDALHKMIDATPDQDQDDANRESAQRLVDKGLLLADAQTFAEQGMKLSDANSAEMMKTIQHTKAEFLSTLGQVYYKAGNLTAAKQTLLQAYQLDDSADSVGTTLAKISAGSGDYGAALTYLIPVMLSGDAEPDDRKAFAQAYAKTHGGSASGMEEFLDQEYIKTWKSPVEVTKYDGPAKNSRAVLLELFGSATCGPCVAADVALDAERERYTPQQLVVLVYHQNVPAADPMTNAETDARGDYYNIDGTPTTYVDGEELEHTGGDKEKAIKVYGRMLESIDARLAKPTNAKIELTGALSGSTVSGKVVVSGVSNATNNLNIQVALVENTLHYTGSNGMRFHPMVVRDLANSGKGFLYKGTENESYDFSFNLDKRDEVLKAYLADVEKKSDDPFEFDRKLLPINPQNVSVVAFIQNAKTKEILQSIFLPITGGGPSSKPSGGQE